MKSFLYQFGLELRLYYRNKMALLYGYLFPTIFLVAFWVLYRHELVPLVNHMGELLTVTALGGACFGLPTSMVSERERGVWRRYRVAPVSTLQLVIGTVAARYVILISAALLQLVLAMLIGMPLPDHLVDLWIAFTLVSFAFLGLGLVIAMLADNVPAVQALGQSIFLPMLIIGGVAVRLESLPGWAQHLSAFFPGRYSVEAIQVSVTGAGIEAAQFSLLALVLVGAAGCLAAAKMFRWDARERFLSGGSRAWLGVALAAWVAVGVLAEATGQVSPGRRSIADSAQHPMPERHDARGDVAAEPESTVDARRGRDTVGGRANGAAGAEPSAPVAPSETTAAQHPDPPAPNGAADAEPDPGEPVGVAEARPETGDDGADRDEEETARRMDTPAADVDAADTADEDVEDRPAEPRPITYPSSWQEVTMEDIERDVRFDALPYDEGLEAPVAAEDDPVYPDMERTLECISEKLADWPPADVDDPVQRARNVLYVAAVPDMYQMSGIENWVPHAVFDHLRTTFPEEQLVKLLYWIATNPGGGTVSAANRIDEVCLAVGGPEDIEMLQQRTGWYAAKLLGRLTGHIRP